MTSPESTSKWYYQAYGLQLCANQPISRLIESTPSSNPDLNITFQEKKYHHSQPEGTTEIYVSPGIADNGEPFFKVWRDNKHPQKYIGIQYTDGNGFASFLCNQEGTQVDVIHTESTPFPDILTYFLGPVLGCILRLRQVTCLHAGVVAVDGKALAIIGPKGMGKSTTVATLSQHGYPVLSDDIAALTEINGQFIVSPGYPQLRLWPKTVVGLPGLSVETLPKILSFADKRFLPLITEEGAGPWRFQTTPLPLGAIYTLSGRMEEDTLSIQPQTKIKSMLTLAGNVYPEYPLHPTDHVRNFDVLGRLADRIPVKEVLLPNDIAALSQIRDAILADFKSIG